jgi:predicted phosphoadenosine phosphosulfate sulfurtransferase
VRNLKLSPSYNETTFAAEYLGVWLGGSDESWFDYSKLTKYRKIKNPEWIQKFREEKNVFYLISVDVGRLHDQTVACIWRVNVRDNKYYATLVNLFVLGRQAETKTFT